MSLRAAMSAWNANVVEAEVLKQTRSDGLLILFRRKNSEHEIFGNIGRHIHHNSPDKFPVSYESGLDLQDL